jgi:hypothetical protein
MRRALRLRGLLAGFLLSVCATLSVAQTAEPAGPALAPETRPRARPEAAPSPSPALSANPATLRHSHAALAEMAMTDPPDAPAFVGPSSQSSALPPSRMRPLARPEDLAATATAPPGGLDSALRPRARPLPPQDPAPLATVAPDRAPVFGLEAPDVPAFSSLAVARALRPPARDPALARQASSRPEPAPLSARGALCGIAGLEGEVLAAIRGSGGCGVEEPVRLISVSGVRLSNAAVMDCTTAAALFEWVRGSAQPRLGNRLARIDTMGSYDCRPRNNQAGARLSEHGRGRAIDIGGFVLTSGDRITVLNHWGSGSWGDVLRAMHRDACGTFGTVLGPNANRAHANHFHFDTARHGNGAYCR